MATTKKEAALLSGTRPADYGTAPPTPPTGSTDVAPPRKATWVTASQIIIADVIGLGVMGMASGMAQLGWVLGIFFCLMMLPLNVSCGLMVWEAQVDAYPGTLSLADVSRAAHGECAGLFTGVITYSFILLTLSDYVLALGLCLAQLIYGTTLSQTAWTLIAAATVLPFAQVRTLNETRLLLWVNTASIVVAVGLCLGHLLWQGRAAALAESGGETHLVAEGLTWTGLTSGVSKFAFAFVGVLMYPEIVCEMAEPREFRRALYATAPFQLGAFLLVGCVGYAYLGDAARGLLTSALPQGRYAQAAAAALYVHLLITYLIKGTVLARFLHRRLAPTTVNDTSARGRLVWLAVTSGLLLSCCCVALAVPAFDELTSLVGSVQTPLLGFAVPAALLYSARRHTGRAMSTATLVALGGVLAFAVVFAAAGTAASTIDIIELWREEEAGAAAQLPPPPSPAPPGEAAAAWLRRAAHASKGAAARFAYGRLSWAGSIAEGAAAAGYTYGFSIGSSPDV